MIEMTQEQRVASGYKAALDSVALINAGKPADWKGTDAEWTETIARNKAHLEIQVAKGSAYYGSKDLTPFTAAIAK